ncbi:hypothetical protein AMTR_s00047p00146560 [Amborella trichopoda]|uniref:Uncharacterized protein n=1 Tax=Amborella trichopoda TaxID=13333 RepID=U5CWR9_AMBTC|nr:hypothetical protein AMTR_s00047p00146560 [Amborella trichopoda]
MEVVSIVQMHAVRPSVLLGGASVPNTYLLQEGGFVIGEAPRSTEVSVPTSEQFLRVTLMELFSSLSS